METLRRYIWALVCIALILVMKFASAADSNQALPRNVFENDPVVTYMMWWRPYKVVFDKQKVLAIQEKINSIEMEKAASTEPDFFSKEEQSAFLFPVLATYGDKGAVILECFLKKYSQKTLLDDRWLLIIACLGRIPTPHAEKILEDEFERVLKEYDFSYLYRSPSREDIEIRRRSPGNDGRRAIMDALLACLAGQQKLTASKIESFAAKYDKGVYFAWLQGLEWVYQLMPKEKVSETIEGLLMSCEDQELRVDGLSSTDRFKALWGFLGERKDIWPLMRNIALQQGERRKTVSDFLLKLYVVILSCYAETGKGVYPLDEDVVNAFITSGIENSRNLSVYCKILLGCKPSSEYPGWNEFLQNHAEHILKTDEIAVKDFVRSIHSGKAKERRISYTMIRNPGVYMRGFRAR